MSHFDQLFLSVRGPLTYESGALPTALRGPAISFCVRMTTARASSQFSDNTSKGHMFDGHMFDVRNDVITVSM